jgi:hypothetical protein
MLRCSVPLRITEEPTKGDEFGAICDQSSGIVRNTHSRRLCHCRGAAFDLYHASSIEKQTKAISIAASMTVIAEASSSASAVAAGGSLGQAGAGKDPVSPVSLQQDLKLLSSERTVIRRCAPRRLGRVGSRRGPGFE